MEKDILKRPAGSVRAAPPKSVPSGDAAAAPEEGASSPAAPLAGGLEKELQARKKAAADAEAAKKKAYEERVAKARIENCARAKQAATTLDSGLRISRAGANGEREILDDAGRAAERAQIQRTIDSECI